MRRWNLSQGNTKVICAVLTAVMVMTGFTACGGSTAERAASAEASEEQETIAPESTTEQSAVESGEEKREAYLGQITAIDGNEIAIALAEKPEASSGEAPNDQTPGGEAPGGAKPDGQEPNGQIPDNNGGAPNGEAPNGEAPNGEAPNGEAPDGQTPGGKAPGREMPDGQAPDGQTPDGNGGAPSGPKTEKEMPDEMVLTLSGDTMTVTVNADTIITIDGKEATLNDLQVGDTASFFLDGEIVTSFSVGMPEPTQSMQAPEHK